MNENKSITEFLGGEYKEFAMYVIESRAIASLVDGLKPSQRKVIHVCNNTWKNGSEKTMKVFQLSGKVANESYYHHGGASLDNAIIGMAQKFKNNLPLLEEDGVFGDLRSPYSAAPRYIGTKLSSNFRLLYKDFELLEYKSEEGETIEPYFFLPIVPTVLLNGGSGIAVGFASNILNRPVKDVINSCIDVLNDKKIKTITPRLNVFNGTYEQDKDNHKKWYIRGTFERVNTNTIRITELPPSMTYKKYNEILDELKENKIITSYDDSSKATPNYTIKMTRESLIQMTDEQIVKTFKLEESETEIFSTIDEKGKLKIFECVEDLIYYFVNFRLGYYQKRKDYILDRLQKEITLLSNRGKFIRAILEEKIKVNNVPKATIIESIKSLNLTEVDGSYDYLLRMPIYSLTKEMYDKIKEDYLSKKKEIEETKLIDPKSMYLDDLNELKKKVSK